MVSGQKTGRLSHKSGRVTMQKHITNSLKQKPRQKVNNYQHFDTNILNQ